MQYLTVVDENLDFDTAILSLYTLHQHLASFVILRVAQDVSGNYSHIKKIIMKVYATIGLSNIQGSGGE